MRRSTTPCLLLALAALAAGCTPPPTALMIRIDSNIAPGTELRRIELAVDRDDGSGQETPPFAHQSWDLTAGRYTLPATLAVIPRDVTDRRSVTVTATGYLAGTDTVVQRARVGIAYTHVSLLDMFLARECVDDRDCSAMPNRTCDRGGVCVDVSRPSLPDYTPDGGAPDASMDTSPTDAQGPDAPADAPDAIDAAPDADGSTTIIGVPRPIAPLSTATVTSQQPTLRWELGGGNDGAVVELCRTRACTPVTQTLPTPGTAVRPTGPLAPGVWFWRLRGAAGSSTSASTSPTWQFTVGARSAPRDTSYGSTLDVNGDGFADLAISVSDTAGTEWMLVYHGRPGGLSDSTPATAVLMGPGSGGEGFGSSVASAGDVDGDGYGDLVVGASLANGGQGRAYLFRGSESGVVMNSPTLLSMPAASSTAHFGNAVAGVGDVNGDGYADVLVGASNDLSTANTTGAAGLFLGGPTGLAGTPSTPLHGPPASGAFGQAIAGLGDYNGDGFADFAVGASSSGNVFLYRGGASPVLDMTLTDSLGFGIAVAGLGDVTGDGCPDLGVGATHGMSNAEVRVYPSTASGCTGGPPVQLMQAPAITLAIAGSDLDGDGYGDIAVGNPSVSSVRLYINSGGTVPTTATSSLSMGGAMGMFGYPVAALGDLDGDGLNDLAVGYDLDATLPATSHANVLVYTHAGMGASLGLDATIGGSSPTSAFGNAIACREPHAAPSGSDARASHAHAHAPRPRSRALRAQRRQRAPLLGVAD